MRRAQDLARQVGASAAITTRAHIQAEVVWFCVPDRAIAGAAEALLEAAAWKGQVALHSSGALASGELAVLRRQGAAVASVHPMMTFVRRGRPSLERVSFAIEGDARAVRVARSIVRSLGGQSFSIRKEQKEAYHAWGMLASPLLDALLVVGERVAGAAGVSRKHARQRMLPILRQTLQNYETAGAADSFSGPIARGDVATVEKHLRVLRSVPGARQVYVALAQAALRDLPGKNRAAMEKILKSRNSEQSIYTQN